MIQYFSSAAEKFNKMKVSQVDMQKYSNITVEMDREKKGGGGRMREDVKLINMINS